MLTEETILYSKLPFPGLTINDLKAVAASVEHGSGETQRLLVSKLSEQRCRFLEIFFGTQHWQVFFETYVICENESEENHKIAVRAHLASCVEILDFLPCFACCCNTRHL